MCILIGSLFAGACSAAAAVGTAAAAAGGAALAAGSAVAGTAAAVGSATLAAGGAIAGTAAAAGGAALGAVGSAAGAIGSATLAAGSATIGAAGSLAGTTAGLVSGAASTIGGAAATAGSFAVGTLGATGVTGAITAATWRKIAFAVLIAGGTGTVVYVALLKKMEQERTEGYKEGYADASEKDEEKFNQQAAAIKKKVAELEGKTEELSKQCKDGLENNEKLRKANKTLEDCLKKLSRTLGKGEGILNSRRNNGERVSTITVSNVNQLKGYYSSAEAALA